MAKRRTSNRVVRGAERITFLPRLEAGDRLDQPTFHARYEAMPEHVRAELIGGIVYMSSPLLCPHGKAHGRLIHWLFEYEDSTLGTEAFDNATAMLNDESEPQPDSCLIIVPPSIGQTRIVDEYITGAPEWVGEVASSSEAIDLHAKLRDYEAAGVKEYVVVGLRQKKVLWFVRRRGKFKELAPDKDGILRSTVFPGLWLDPVALLRHDGKRLMEVLRQGLATPEHAAFVAKLAKG